MATTIVTKYGSDAPAASDIVRGELAVDTENGRLYTENSSGAVVEIGLNPEGNVDVTGTVTTTGNVGIGVSPNYPIHVEKSVGGDWLGKFKNTHATNGYGLLIHAGDDASVAALSVGNYAGAGDYLVVKGDGKVGIGTSSINSNAALEVHGGQLRVAASSQSSMFAVATSTTYSDGVTLFSSYNGSGSYGPMIFDVNGEAMRIDASKNVTILASGADASRTLSVQGTNGSSQTYQFNIVADGENSAAKFMVGSGGGAASERARIDSSGNLILSGTSAGDATSIALHNGGYVHAVTSHQMSGIFDRRDSDGDILIFRKDGTAVGSIGADGGSLVIGGGDVGIGFYQSADALVPINGGTRALRDAAIDLGTSSAKFKDLYLSGDCRPTRVITNNSGDWGMEMQGATIARIRFHTSAGGSGEVGSVTVSTTSTAYNTSSDYRLKENVVAITGATDRLKQLKPSRFNFIADADTTVDGFLAHEVQDVVPEAITGAKDAMRDEEYEVTPAVLDDDGNVITEAVMGTRSVPDYQGIDQSKLVPLLVATIQELEARIAALES